MRTRLYLFTLVLLMAVSAWAGDAEGNDGRISGYAKMPQRTTLFSTLKGGMDIPPLPHSGHHLR